VDVARYHNDIAAIRSRFPGDAEVAHASRHADLLRNTNTGAFTCGFVTDVTNKTEEYRGAESYTNTKKVLARVRGARGGQLGADDQVGGN
jgi:hypothetical protein